MPFVDMSAVYLVLSVSFTNLPVPPSPRSLEIDKTLPVNNKGRNDIFLGSADCVYFFSSAVPAGRQLIDGRKNS